MSPDEELLESLVAFANDPLAFATWAFPWGEPGVLVNRSLEDWQIGLLADIRDKLLTPAEAIREATVSGNGVGKSALVSILILWATTTAPDTLGVVTANTETQLKTKTWAQLGKWFNLFIGRRFFELTATALFSRDPDHTRTWRTDAIAWSEHNAVAFQGLHNEGKRLFIIFDEASGIKDPIWEAADGCMTDASTQRLWLVFGNPNLPTGRFRECFAGGKYASRWQSRKIDSRSVSFTDKEEFAAWIAAEGEDSDFVRVRIKGEFPRVGLDTFIGPALAQSAVGRDVHTNVFDPLIIGVDVARSEIGDASVIYFRKGRDGASIPPIVFHTRDTMQIAARVAEEHLRYRADAIFVDGTGVGGGVVDRLRQLRVPVIEVQFGAKPDRNDPEEPNIRYANKRAEIWGAMKRWLAEGSILDNGLVDELCRPQYSHNVNNEIILEKKDLMRSRGGSPDRADALALTFAYPVIPSAFAGGPGAKPTVEIDYDPFSETFMR